ncbi:MAG: hypothetical protein U9Q03_04610 [Patescibacteria group bacterium]|nr:hypothetical protein [Patescibacteria group bacterium]
MSDRPVEEGACPTCGESDWTLQTLGFGYGPLSENMHPCHIDGPSECYCNNCGTRVGVWTRRVLKEGEKEGEHEPPHGGSHREICPFHEPEKVETV